MFKAISIKELLAGVVLCCWLGGSVQASPIQADPIQAETIENEFEGKSLYDLSKAVSEATGYTIVFSPRVRLNRKVEVYSQEDMPKDKLFEVYQSILGLYGYVVILNDNVARVVRDRRARSMPIPVISDDNN